LPVTVLVSDQTATDVTSAVTSAAQVTATVSDGVITIGGNDAALVDTIGEIKAIFEAIDTASTADVAAIEMGGNTYVITDDNSNPDVTQDIIKLTGLTGVTAISTAGGATTIKIK